MVVSGCRCPSRSRARSRPALVSSARAAPFVGAPDWFHNPRSARSATENFQFPGRFVDARKQPRFVVPLTDEKKFHKPRAVATQILFVCRNIPEAPFPGITLNATEGLLPHQVAQ